MHTHILILLDRSGSMEHIADDVIGGFNRFLADQQAAGPDARITLVQFDTQDPQEVVLRGVPILEAEPLSRAVFKPRGGTPLYDATALLIERARLAAEVRAEQGLPPEQVLFVSITDGEENQSRHHTLPQVRAMIKECEAQGWVFAFLSAGLDAYGEADRLGVARANTRAYLADSDGVNGMFGVLSRGVWMKRCDPSAPLFEED